ncbi:hypothetical protein ACFW53_25695 [Nocardiopsis dassonvillei]|uniref:hypothetical protein n=1 Tax=Nocardiopsis dassonvillei TaxID=2014 RepID=UPI0036729ADA
MTFATRHEATIEDETAVFTMAVNPMSESRSSTVRYRASSGRFTADQAHVGDQEPKGDLRPPVVDPTILRDHLTDLGGGVGLEVTAQIGRRKYRDSTGFRIENIRTWFNVQLFSNSREDGASVRDGTDDLSSVPELLSGMAQDLLDQRRRQSFPVHRLPRRATLVLPSNLAGILVHELVGHLLEEANPERVGPKGFSVEARLPPGREFDDFGEPVQNRLLVMDGAVPHLDREERVKGFAQAGWHQVPPIPRFTNLTVFPYMSSDAVLREEYVVCHRSRGAELIGRRAVVTVDDAELIRGETAVGRFQPFMFVVDVEALGDAMVALLGASLPGRAGTCVKAGQGLPTRVTSPLIVLDGVALYELT